MTELYPQAETQQLKRIVRRLTCLAWLTALAALAICILCCVRVTTISATQLRWTAVAASALGGWAVILLHGLAISPCRARLRHAEGLGEGARETMTGVLTASRQTFQIPGSVRVRKVLLDGPEPHSLHVADSKARLLPPEGTRVRVEAVRRYIVAWEVCHEDD